MKTREQLAALAVKVDALSLRERVLIFCAIAFLLVSLADTFFLRPLLQRQKAVYDQLVQQQEKMKEVQARQMALTQAQQADVNSPQRQRIRELREQIEAGETFLKDKRNKLVPPDEMAALLEQVLRRNGGLQLQAMESLPVTPFIEPVDGKSGGGEAPQPGQDGQMYKHGVKITVRGTYADLTRYLTELERLPTRMFWGSAKMNVVQYPSVELTLTLYTLSLDKTWLQV
jgi:MSHA biogenesis protein MshJ